MILLPPKPLRNQELVPGTELEINSSNMQSHLGKCHNLHLGLKAQCEPAEKYIFNMLDNKASAVTHKY